MKHRITALAALAVFGTAACVPTDTPATPAADAVSEAAQPSISGAPTAGSAANVLATLPVKGRAPKTGYDRDEFGATWADVDRNGCDTRNDVLARDLTGEQFRPGTQDCVVVSGTLVDPYTAQTIAFQKGDGDAATWLPADRGYRCTYVARQVAVKAAYGLWVTQAEHDAIARVLDTCPGEPVPTSSAVEPFADCDAARAAGAAPLHRGDPGWSDRMDGDGDGTACE